MFALKRALAVLLGAVALSWGLNWIATPLYHDGSDNYPVWIALNLLAAPATLVMLVVNVARKLSLKGERADGPVTRVYLETNLAFCASITLALWYYWNWFGALFPDTESEAVGLIHLGFWPFICPVMVLTATFTARYLWRTASEEDGE